MKKTGTGSIVRLLLLLIFLHSAAAASEVIDFTQVANNREVTFFLSTPKSGTNVITGCLSAITRRPISWFYWGDTILDPSSPGRNHISYNRLQLPMLSDRPLLYRTHYEFNQLMGVPSTLNRLIFLTRNPKELLYRHFFLTASHGESPDPSFVQKFFDKYLRAFQVYESWCPAMRMLVLYEDFIANDEEVLLEVVQFMAVDSPFLDDFLSHKQEYLARLHESYSLQHTHNSGGASSREGAHPIYYTSDVPREELLAVDEYLMKAAPEIWDKYLQRYAER